MALKFQILFGDLFQISNERANFKPYVIVTVTNTGKNTRTPYKKICYKRWICYKYWNYRDTLSENK
jgi:hypothetical protein